jgi:hypothetical protein
MRSQLDVLVRPRPQVLHRPGDVHSLDAARDTIELANAYLGHDLIPAQELVIETGLGQRVDESWSAATVCHFGGRQGAGKNETVIAVELAGLILFGEQLILHTAHEFKTANESFLRLVSIFENFDDLRRLVARVRYANGEQGIEFLSGQRLKFLARTGGAGRGFAGVDRLVLDEAQHLLPEHLAALAPTMLANPNAQAWAMGSGGLATSEVAWRWRRQGLAGLGDRFAYVEFTAEDVRLVDGKVVTSSPDAMDRDGWARAMPAYGAYVTDESVMQLLDLLGPEKFIREGLCVWDPEPRMLGSVIDAGLWAACGDVRSQIASDLRLGFDVTPDRAWSSIAAAGLRADGLPHVEVLEHRAGTGWVAGRLAELGQHRPGLVVCDPAGPAGSLVAEVEAGGVDVRLVSTREATQACGLIFDDVVEGRLRFPDPQPELSAAVAAAGRRPVGDAWLWDRKGSVGTIAPLVAATWARWAVGQPAAKRDADFFVI